MKCGFEMGYNDSRKIILDGDIYSMRLSDIQYFDMRDGQTQGRSKANVCPTHRQTLVPHFHPNFVGRGNKNKLSKTTNLLYFISHRVT